MRLVIVRHAEAASGHPDELRPLTDAGRAQARQLGADLRAQGLEPEAILCSPLLRARETATLLALGDPAVDDRLAPGATPDDLRAIAEEHAGTVVVVGHQPDCGHAAAELGDGIERPFPPCAYATVELA